jgi:hypothetical protein
MSQAKPRFVSAVFRDRHAAQVAYTRLTALGHGDNVNVLMSENTRAMFEEDDEQEILTGGTRAVEGAGLGGAIGTAVGATLAALLAIGSSVVVPGLGLVVAGPFAAGLVGAGAGAITGGLAGGLIGLGIPEANVESYHRALRQGGVIIGVTPKDAREETTILDTFADLGGENICVS